MHNQCLGSLYRQRRKQHSHCRILKMSINRASTIFSFASWVTLVLATGPGNLPAVRVWTTKTDWFGSGTEQKPDPVPLGGPNRDPYPSSYGFCQIWLVLSVPIFSSVFRVLLFMVTFTYVTVNCKILTLVCRCLFLMY